VREALFARLGELDGVEVLDLYSGTGALGIEALSRGARAATFVDSAARSLAVLRRNLSDLGLESRARVMKGDAAAVVGRLARAGCRFDLVLLDPPYGSDELAGTLARLVKSGALDLGATVVVECATRHPLGAEYIAGAGLVLVDERRYGDTLILRMRQKAAKAEQAEGGSGGRR
jgi:16S rRNA (guanine966-N2)-methyltransferase